MKVKNYVFFGLIFLLVVCLSGFAHLKNKNREVTEFEISFEFNSSHFLNDSIVNKLLIQNTQSLPWKSLDSLDLNMLESLIEKNPFIQNAEVFNYPHGIVGVRIQERKPVLRILGDANYYIDQFANEVPLSKRYSPNVPVYMGTLNEVRKKEVLSILKAIKQDLFLESELAAIFIKNNSYYLALRSFDFEIEIGRLNDFSAKLDKLKIFCAYQQNNESEKQYKHISLKFKNQIVGS